jgi:hypothetical protein
MRELRRGRICTIIVNASPCVLRTLQLALTTFVAAIFAGASASCAEDLNWTAAKFETYLTADYTGRSGNLSTSTVWSPFAPLGASGFRLKLDGFANVYGDTSANIFSSGFLVADLKAAGDLMAGYQINRDQLWVKLYAGAVYQRQTQVIWQIGQLAQQESWGAAAAIEGYWKASDRVWFSANVSWLQVDNNASLFYRTGYEIFRNDSGLKISSGAEGGVAVSNANIFKEGKRLDLYNDFIRGGAFINLRYGTHELTLSGGLSQAGNEDVQRPYATLTYGKKF